MYRYNGKDLDEATGLYDYGARYYDPAVARFTSIDPSAEKYAPWSPYSYVFNNPLLFIDPDGRDPIYGKNGKLIGYRVEAGQGPTQIAEDLNTYYSCQLTCEVNWVQIVHDNADQFQNVIDGDGKIDDEYNGDYKEGNIEPGDILAIDGGLDVKKEEELEGGIDQENHEIDSLNDIVGETKHELKLMTDTKSHLPVGPDPKTGPAIGDFVNRMIKYRRINKAKEGVQEREQRRDSLQKRLDQVRRGHDQK